MNTNSQLAVVQDETGFTQTQIDIIKSQVAPPGTTNEELALFLAYAQKTGLDCLSRQIYLSERRSKDRNGNWVTKRVPETTIDGFRLIAERTGKYTGQIGPEWCGKDGQWVDVWLDPNPPSAARVGIMRSDFDKPLSSVALWSEYVQTTSNGEPNSMWSKRGSAQLAKCAEALGLRRAFPRELSGLYSREEMGQAENVDHEPRGSAEAAANVARERIASLGGDPAVVEAPKPKVTRTKKASTVDEPKGWSEDKAKQFTMFKEFCRTVKGNLRHFTGDDKAYYQILSDEGCKNCTDAKDEEHGKRLMQRLSAASKSLKVAAANRQEIEDIRVQLGHDEFWRVLNGLGVEDDDTLDSTGNDGLVRVLEALRAFPATAGSVASVANPPASNVDDVDKSGWLPGNINRVEPLYMKEVRTVAAQMAAAKGPGKWRDLLGACGCEDIESIPNQETAKLVVDQAREWLNANPNKPVFTMPKGAA